MTADGVAQEFLATFGRAPDVFRAPGRVNLVGEHTDYSDGFVMPMAIDRYTWVAAAPRTDGQIVARSRECGGDGPWLRYVRGVAAVLARDGCAIGADLYIASDVPIGAGLSSSAALAVACGRAFSSLAGLTIDRTALARACQRAEHEYVGTRCGIMDQMIACHGQAGHLLKLDTRTLTCEQVPLPPSVRVMVANTMVSHAHATNEYNRRRAECEAGVRILARRFPHVRALRDVTFDQLQAVADEMPDAVARRCRHVIAENARVLCAADALGRGDFRAVGRLMAESHASLRDDFEVSCAELDAMVAIAAARPGVHGARMTGGGFGGSVVALVDAGIDEAGTREAVRRQYAARTGLAPDVWFCSAGAGAS